MSGMPCALLYIDAGGETRPPTPRRETRQTQSCPRRASFGERRDKPILPQRRNSVHFSANEFGPPISIGQSIAQLLAINRGPYRPFPEVDGPHLHGLVVVLAKLQPIGAVVAALIHLAHPVPLVAEMPGDVAVGKGTDRLGDLGVLAVQHLNHPLRGADRVSDDTVEGLLLRDALHPAVTRHQIDLVSRVAVLLVKGHEVVDEGDRRLDLGNDRRDLREEGLFVKVAPGEETAAADAAQTVQATKMEGEGFRPGVTKKIMLLHPAALEVVKGAARDGQGAIAPVVTEELGQVGVHQPPERMLLLLALDEVAAERFHL
ncbi:hypothetical protein G6O67_003353 [Ophiocordyceps sinensis]|uniref:Uncharacterized protein n=1 Tax=Ophiocordyceps sinensis TaxID=72228 RepID=A0A8H4PW17_9HYPO|nr:hypothetical protein G6O67_003353 [Ophiocordyceps sinensis]